MSRNHRVFGDFPTSRRADVTRAHHDGDNDRLAASVYNLIVLSNVRGVRDPASLNGCPNRVASLGLYVVPVFMLSQYCE